MKYCQRRRASILRTRHWVLLTDDESGLQIGPAFDMTHIPADHIRVSYCRSDWLYHDCIIRVDLCWERLALAGGSALYLIRALWIASYSRKRLFANTTTICCGSLGVCLCLQPYDVLPANLWVCLALHAETTRSP